MIKDKNTISIVTPSKFNYNGSYYQDAQGNNWYISGTLNINSDIIYEKNSKQSFFFDGGTRFYSVSSILPTGSNKRTVDFWFYPLDLGKRYIFGNGSESNNCYWSSDIESGLSLVCWSNDHFSGVYPTTNVWNHAAYTFDGTYTKIYLNGKQILSTSAGSGMVSSQFCIGGRHGGELFYGYISSLRISSNVRFTENFNTNIVDTPEVKLIYANFKIKE